MTNVTQIHTVTELIVKYDLYNQWCKDGYLDVSKKFYRARHVVHDNV